MDGSRAILECHDATRPQKQAPLCLQGASQCDGCARPLPARRPPAWIVLSACDAGRSEVHPGNELMGTSAALLSLGTRAIVSSVAPVPDDGVTAIMVALHEELGHGRGLAAALAAAQARAIPEALAIGDLASGDPKAREALAASAFVCLGAG